MASVLDDPDGRFVVLVNNENQHSLWPLAASVPVGWRVARGEGSREACVSYLEDSWKDLRPRSLAEDLAS